MPVKLLPMLSEFTASAMRPVPEHQSMLKAYDMAPFVNETKLTMPILRFQKVMRRMEEWGTTGRRQTTSSTAMCVRSRCQFSPMSDRKTTKIDLLYKSLPDR